MWLLSERPIAGNLPFELKAGEFAIGRSKECQIVLRDSSISRVHARLTVNPAGDLHLLDLGSCNGTFVNSRSVSEIRPSHKDSLRLGAVLLFFAPGPSFHDEPHDEVEDPTVRGASSGPKKRTRFDPALTRPQKEVLQLVVQGRTDEEVANLLNRSYHTIRNHLKVIFKVYEVHSKHELLATINRRM